MDFHLVALDPDHPGFRDATYRQRRDTIARIARAHRAGEPVPAAPYSEQEHGVWAEVLSALAPVHAQGVHRELLAVDAALGLDRARIPQLEDVNARLQPAGFRMEPVAGLVTPRTFLEHLGRGISCPRSTSATTAAPSTRRSRMWCTSWWAMQRACSTPGLPGSPVTLVGWPKAPARS